ncbi:MAG TPA: exodeoxyribonuclease III, partial [bacterium]|nr:exodeoxyribonuclease III [bacterium]
ACFTPQERAWFTAFLEAGYVDSFRERVNEGGHYTWWTYRHNARERNIGWRLDYFLISQALTSRLADSRILREVHGSDHCPVRLTLKSESDPA